MRNPSLILLAAFSLSIPALGETVFVEASRDATLIESPDGSRANGSGPNFFVGRTAQERDSIRRALLRFDVASVLPNRAVIEEVSLTLYSEPGNPSPREIRLHRVQADWGEGSSSSSGGGGRPSQPGDATWIHTFFDDQTWVRPGGHFIGRVSARQVVEDAGSYTWESTQFLVQDVRLWNSAAQRNFGWILIGDESTPQNAKSFASRENPILDLRPLLTVTYRLPGKR